MVKSVVFVLNNIAGGGIARVVTSYANQLVNHDIKVTLLILHKKEHFYTVDDRVETIENEFIRKDGNKLLYTYRTYQFIRNSILKIRPDVVVSNGEWINSFVILSLLGVDTKIFLVDHSNPKIKLGLIHDSLKHLSYNRAEGIITLSNNAKIILSQKIAKTPIYVLPNPINFITAQAVEKKNIIISIGRMTQVKGHRFLIEAFARAGLENWSLSLVGDGPELENLKRLTKELNIANRVNFYGKRSNIEDYLSESKIFVLPSLSENFPMALTEAMSVPIACIATDCLSGKGSESIIQHHINGLLVEPGNSTVLAEALKELAVNKELREKLAVNAYAIRKKYSSNAIAGRLMEILNN